VRLDAFVLHELQRYRFGYKNFCDFGATQKKSPAAVESACLQPRVPKEK